MTIGPRPDSAGSGLVTADAASGDGGRCAGRRARAAVPARPRRRRAGRRGLELVDRAGSRGSGRSGRARPRRRRPDRARRSRRGRSASATTAVAAGAGQLAPQGEPAARAGGTASRAGRVRPRAASASRCSRSRARWAARIASGVGQQPGQHELLEHRGAEVEAQPGLGQRVHLRVRRAQPAEPQAAPERLAGAADGDRVRGVRRERRAASPARRAPAPGAPRRRPATVRARRRCGGVLRPLLVGHQVAGRVLEVRDQVGQPRRGLPQRRGRPPAGPSPRGRPGCRSSRAPPCRIAWVAFG